ncbi:MAG: hypothetical protein FWD24_05745 [Treponema sp.]|nr:hypothetical protein [Treponema sp.]
MQRRILISNIDNNPVVSFNTGLDPRSFARTKMSQSMIEQGYVVSPNGSHTIWKSAGVNDIENIMHVWGPLFNGKRLDILIDDVSALTQNNSSQVALQAVLLWMRAKLFLGDKKSAANPGSAFICTENDNVSHPKGSIFFSPPNLSNRCLFIEGAELDRYNCPDLTGLEAATFCAGVMLYKILTGSHPYPSADIYQDMREGVFLPVNLAAPNLDTKISDLIQAALLLPVVNKKVTLNLKAVDIITNMIKTLLGGDNKMVSISSLYNPLPVEKERRFEKERKNYLFKQNYKVKIKRFFARNRIGVIAAISILFFAGFITFSMVAGASRRPTTEGMPSGSVVHAYFNALSSLDHMFMEAILNGASKEDLNYAINMTAGIKAMQAYDMSSAVLIPAGAWVNNGGELPAPNVFGVTDITLEHMAGNEGDDMMVYRVNYLLWPYNEGYSISRTDVITLRRDRKGNWRITEITRIER